MGQNLFWAKTSQRLRHTDIRRCILDEHSYFPYYYVPYHIPFVLYYQWIYRPGYTQGLLAFCFSCICSIDALTDQIEMLLRQMQFFLQTQAPLNSVLKLVRKQERKESLKKKARHSEWQLPQLLAGTLIKTKLVSFSEQTWQALSRGAFFSTPAKILSECRCSRNVYKGGGQGRADLFLSPLCMWVSICVFIYIFAHVFPPNPDCFHACFGCTAEKYTQQWFLAPLCSFAVVENWSESKWLLCYWGEAGGCPKQDQMQGSWRLLGLIEGVSVAPAEPLTGFTEAWQTGQFPLCTPLQHNEYSSTWSHDSLGKIYLLEDHKGTYE